jgi:nitrous oxide reductase accessory protein NosL
MKRIWISLVLIMALATFCSAAEKVVEQPADCIHCGMNRTTFAHSRMLIKYADGSSTGTCSIYCIATDMKAAKGKQVKSIQVADYNSKKLIDARKAAWVIGGDKSGVMTPIAKWAFADKKAAKGFVAKHGGKLANFEEVLDASKKEQEANDK